MAGARGPNFCVSGPAGHASAASAASAASVSDSECPVLRLLPLLPLPPLLPTSVTWLCYLALLPGSVTSLLMQERQTCCRGVHGRRRLEEAREAASTWLRCQCPTHRLMENPCQSQCLPLQYQEKVPVPVPVPVTRKSKKKKGLFKIPQLLSSSSPPLLPSPPLSSPLLSSPPPLLFFLFTQIYYPLPILCPFHPLAIPTAFTRRLISPPSLPTLSCFLLGPWSLVLATLPFTHPPPTSDSTQHPTSPHHIPLHTQHQICSAQRFKHGMNMTSLLLDCQPLSDL